jgi:SPX domain protein involved in polyphosphate accumulation
MHFPSEQQHFHLHCSFFCTINLIDFTTMKFCRNLQRVIDITDPEWAPYWTNYKMLKKFLKNLPSFVPPDGAADASNSSASASRAASPDSSTKMGETPAPPGAADRAISEASADKEAREDEEVEGESAASNETTKSRQTTATKMARNPGEVAFFRLLNSELRKAIHFFDKAQLEFEIREARVREGIEIMRKANSLMVSEKWTLMAKSLYRLYKDLLLLETYAIMTYCSFSKILKKHDKVTSHNTRMAFMKNVVNKANFTHYPKLLAMISRCENLYEEVSQSLIQVSSYYVLCSFHFK